MAGSSGKRTLYIVDGDEAVRDSYRALLEAFGMQVYVFGAAEDLLQHGTFPDSACLIIDPHSAGVSAGDLLNHLKARGVTMPTIFIAGRPDAAFRRSAQAAGVVAVLDKPDGAEALLQAIDRAFAGMNRKF